MKPRRSHYTGAILKKLAVFMRTVELFHLQLGCRKIEECFQCVGSFATTGWEALLQLGGKLWCSGNWLLVSRHGLMVASQLQSAT